MGTLVSRLKALPSPPTTTRRRATRASMVGFSLTILNHLPPGYESYSQNTLSFLSSKLNGRRNTEDATGRLVQARGPACHGGEPGPAGRLSRMTVSLSTVEVTHPSWTGVGRAWLLWARLQGPATCPSQLWMGRLGRWHFPWRWQQILTRLLVLIGSRKVKAVKLMWRMCSHELTRAHTSHKLGKNLKNERLSDSLMIMNGVPDRVESK